MALYESKGALGAAVVQVDANAWCVGVSAFAASGVSNATVSVNGGEAVPVPPGGSVNLHPPLGTLKAPSLTFVNTAGYGYEIVE